MSAPLQVVEIYSDMEDLAEQISNYGPAQEFSESVMKKAKDICESAEYMECETPEMVNAMENMKGSLEKWIRKR